MVTFLRRACACFEDPLACSFFAPFCFLSPPWSGAFTCACTCRSLMRSVRRIVIYAYDINRHGKKYSQKKRRTPNSNSMCVFPRRLEDALLIYIRVLPDRENPLHHWSHDPHDENYDACVFSLEKNLIFERMYHGNVSFDRHCCEVKGGHGESRKYKKSRPPEAAEEKPGRAPMPEPMTHNTGCRECDDGQGRDEVSKRLIEDEEVSLATF